MLKDITLGQFFPGESVVHRLDPRTKLLITMAFIVVLFMAKGIPAYLLCAAAILTVVAVSWLPLKLIGRGIKPVYFIVAFTALLNMFYTPGVVLVEIWFLRITREGIISALFMASRIVLLITSTSLLTYTTSPMALTDAIETLLGPLKKLKVPVHEFAMMMTIALRMIPTLIEETEKIMSAQKARGADFESGNILRRAKALIPVLVPLFISAFRRADELAIAMECRLYAGGEGRTRMHVLRLRPVDLWAAAICLCFFALVVLVSRTLVFP